MRKGVLACTALAVVAGLSLACLGGYGSADRREWGNPEGGVYLAAGDIAVAAGGSFIAWRYEVDDHAWLAVGDPNDGTVHRTPIADPVRLAFSPQDRVVYVLHADLGGGVIAFDVEAFKVLWEVALPGVLATAELDVSGDDSLLLLHQGHHAAVLDAYDGALLHALSFERPLADADLLPGNARVAFVEQERWVDSEPLSRVTVLEVGTDEPVVSFDIPNCASRLEVVAATQVGFLAPTFCAEDPVSVMSFVPGQEQFLRNLPGFGPVELTAGGEQVLAFYDHALRDESLFDDPSQIPGEDAPRFHLMLIDSATLDFELLPYGQHRPRYAMDPTGRHLLVDSPGQSTLSVYDTEEARFRPIFGVRPTLSEFGFGPGGERVHHLERDTEFGPSPGLLELDLRLYRGSRQSVPFVPTSLNVSPDGHTLFLRRDEARVCVWDLQAAACRLVLDLEQVEPGIAALGPR